VLLNKAGNWQAVAEHVGTRTKEEVEEHYNSVYIDSPNWPRPVRLFFLLHLYLLIWETRSGCTYVLTSIPRNSKNGSGGDIQHVSCSTTTKSSAYFCAGVHDIATFLPGRLEFEHEIDNEAEDLIKNLEFGSVWHGAATLFQNEDDHDTDRMRWKEEQKEKIMIKRWFRLTERSVNAPSTAMETV